MERGELYHDRLTDCMQDVSAAKLNAEKAMHRLCTQMRGLVTFLKRLSSCMRVRAYTTKIDTEISIVTLGSVCLLIASFTEDSYDVPLFILSGFCLVLSGAILIYRKTVIRGDLLPVGEKKERGENLKFSDYTKIGNSGILGIVANTLFDIGILFLMWGAGAILYFEFIEEFVITESFLCFLVVLIIMVLIRNFFNRRFF